VTYFLRPAIVAAAVGSIKNPRPAISIPASTISSSATPINVPLLLVTAFSICAPLTGLSIAIPSAMVFSIFRNRYLSEVRGLWRKR